MARPIGIRRAIRASKHDERQPAQGCVAHRSGRRNACKAVTSTTKTSHVAQQRRNRRSPSRSAGRAPCCACRWRRSAPRRRPSSRRSGRRRGRRRGTRSRRAALHARRGSRVVKVSTNRLPPRSWQSGRKANTASASPICISSKSPGMPRLVSHRATTLTVTSTASASSSTPPARARRSLTRRGDADRPHDPQGSDGALRPAGTWRSAPVPSPAAWRRRRRRSSWRRASCRSPGGSSRASARSPPRSAW